MHVPVQVTVKLAAPVSGAIGSLNAARTGVLMPTPVALLTGTTAVTVGGAAVVNCQLYGAARALPVPSDVAPVTVAV